MELARQGDSETDVAPTEQSVAISRRRPLLEITGGHPTSPSYFTFLPLFVPSLSFHSFPLLPTSKIPIRGLGIAVSFHATHNDIYISIFVLFLFSWDV